MPQKTIRVCLLVLALLLVAFIAPFVAAQSNNFGVGYGWNIGNATPIPTPISSFTSTPLPSNISLTQSTTSANPHSSTSPSQSPTISEENPLLILVFVLVLGLVGALVFKVRQKKKLTLSKLALLVCICFVCCFFFLSSVSAQVGTGWQTGNGWQGSSTPTPTGPSISPSPYSFNPIASGFAALGLFAIVPIISVAGLIVGVVLTTRSEEPVDPKVIVATIVLVMVVNIIVVVGALILNGVQNAMPSYLWGLL